MKAKWTAADIPDQTGKIAIVTGASSGVGYEIALQLATHGAHVVVASRDRDRTREAADKIKAAAPGVSVEDRVLDLASLDSVRDFVRALSTQHDRVDVLVNNAGISGGPRRETRDGYEAHFQVNYLGHFALTGLLLPALRARTGARVVTMSSDVAARGSIDFDDLQSARKYGLVSAYSQSKLANLLFAFTLDRSSREAKWGLSSFAAHPGVAKSNLLENKRADWGRGRSGIEHVLRLVQTVLAQPAAMGALSALYQATDPQARSQDYVGPVGLLHGRGYPGVSKIPPAALDHAVAERLWAVAAELSGVPFAAAD